MVLQLPQLFPADAAVVCAAAEAASRISNVLPIFFPSVKPVGKWLSQELYGVHKTLHQPSLLLTLVRVPVRWYGFLRLDSHRACLELGFM